MKGFGRGGAGRRRGRGQARRRSSRRDVHDGDQGPLVLSRLLLTSTKRKGRHRRRRGPSKKDTDKKRLKINKTLNKQNPKNETQQEREA